MRAPRGARWRSTSYHPGLDTLRTGDPVRVGRSDPVQGSQPVLPPLLVPISILRAVAAVFARAPRSVIQASGTPDWGTLTQLGLTDAHVRVAEQGDIDPPVPPGRDPRVRDHPSGPIYTVFLNRPLNDFAPARHGRGGTATILPDSGCRKSKTRARLAYLLRGRTSLRLYRPCNTILRNMLALDQ